MAVQATIQPRARGLGVYELTGDDQQVIQWQQQQLAQSGHHDFLGFGKGGTEFPGAVGAILNVVATLPLARGSDADVVALGQLLGAGLGIPDLALGARCGAG